MPDEYRTDFVDGEKIMANDQNVNFTLIKEGRPFDPHSITGEIVALDTIDMENLTPAVRSAIASGGAAKGQEVFTVTNPSIKTYTLAHTPVTDTEEVVLNGLSLSKGSSNDYTVSGSDIILDALVQLEIGDILTVMYNYNP